MLWNRKFLQYIGTRCYSIYLTHFMVISLAQSIQQVGTISEFIRNLPLSGFQILIWFGVLLCAVIGVGEIAYRLIERPLTELGKVLLSSPGGAVLHPHSPSTQISR